jgi:hypothetical protein
MKIIKIKNWESLNCNDLLFKLITILSINKKISIYLKSKHYNGSIERSSKSFESKYHVWIKLEILNNEDIKIHEPFFNEYNKEIFGCLHGCVRNITGYFPGFSKIYQTYNQLIKIRWYSNVNVIQDKSVDTIDFFKYDINFLDKYLLQYNYDYLPAYYSDDKKLHEKQISVFCDHFGYSKYYIL